MPGDSNSMSCERILVVDDDQASARRIELQLIKMGYVVVSIAENGPEAIAKAGSFAPDLLLIDINLGRDMDGIETARIIMQKCQVPVVFLSAQADADTLARALDTQPLGYVTKPLRESDLRSTISLALTRMNSNPGPVPPPIPANEALWRIKLTCNTDGRITRTPHDSKTLLQQLGMENIQDLLPAAHGEHVRASVSSKKQQLIFTTIGKTTLLLEYVPVVNGIVNVFITAQPERNSSVNQDNVTPVEYLDTLDHLAAGIILFNENMQIFYSNKSAQRLLSDGTCLKNYHGYLTCEDPEITAELKEIAVDQKDHLFSIERGASRPALHVLVTTLKSGRANVGRNLPTTIMFAFETTTNYARIEEVVRSLYRLSPSEAKVVSQLFITPHLPTAAAALGITLNTARTHLKRIYIKTRVNRISSLIHMIVTGPASIILNTDA